MKQIINLHIEKLPEDVYLATSDDIFGLVAQGRTITETLEIARDIANKLLEAEAEHHLNIEKAKLNPEQFFGVSHVEHVDQLLETIRDEWKHLGGAGFATPLLTFLRCLSKMVMLNQRKTFRTGNMPRPACLQAYPT